MKGCKKMRFEAGKTYNARKGLITITKRTAHYVTFTGYMSGKRMIHDYNLFGQGENIVVRDPQTGFAIIVSAAQVVG